jgi:hypothetical protein
MNDQFVPAPPVVATQQQAHAAGGVVSVEALPPEIQAAMQHAKAIGSQKFQQLFRAVALWEQATQTIKTINTEEEHQNIIKLFDNVKRALKSAEEFRLDLVSVPTKYTRLVNATFKPLTSKLLTVKEHFGDMLAKRQAEIELEHQKKLEEAQKAQEAQAPAQEIQTGDGEGKVAMTPVADVSMAPPPSTIKTASGEKASFRERTVITINDPMELLKAIVSKGKRNEVYTTDLVTFNEPEIKKLCVGKRKIPGVAWKIEKIAV